MKSYQEHLKNFEVKIIQKQKIEDHELINVILDILKEVFEEEDMNCIRHRRTPDNQKATIKAYNRYQSYVHEFIKKFGICCYEKDAFRNLIKIMLPEIYDSLYQNTIKKITEK